MRCDVDHFQRIYAKHAADYDTLVRAEDCDDVLVPALQALPGVTGSTVLDVGTGTGRLARLLLRAGAQRVVGVDQAVGMLRVAQSQAPTGGLAAARAGQLPLRDACFDHVAAGWVFGHSTQWNQDGWRTEVTALLAESRRVTRAGGVQVLLETLGTGATSPAPPTPALAALYEELETTHGFRRQTLQTDYQFADVDTAARICGFFFGEGLVERIREKAWVRVPEWTGLWWRRV